MVFCPECNRPVDLKDPKLGLLVTCQSCETELEVINLDPLALDWVYYGAEDWETNDIEDYDDYEDFLTEDFAEEV
jgi:lysine biosynthesis protein LysW